MIGRLARATILTAICDGLFSSTLNVFAYGSTVKRLWQGVASVPFVANALQQDSMAWVGLAMHVGVALAWSTLFLALYELLPPLRRMVAAPFGVLSTFADKQRGPFPVDHAAPRGVERAANGRRVAVNLAIGRQASAAAPHHAGQL